MKTKKQKIYEDWCGAWNTDQVDKVLSYVTDDIVYEDVPMARVSRGKAEMKAFAQEAFTAFPDFKLELKSFLASGNRACAEYVMTGTFLGEIQSAGLKPTGKSFSVRGISMVELRGGKIRRHTDYYDGATFLRQIGVTL
jgi:steroid delta-isomerase-like uncharacterized protein